MGLISYKSYHLGYINAINDQRDAKRLAAPKLDKYHTGKPDPQEMLELVNKERAKVGVAPIKIDSTMSATATWKANDMHIRNYFGHDMPGTNEMLPKNVMQLKWDECVKSGENITYHNNGDETNTSYHTVQNFINSKPHYEAIINPNYKLIGFGVAGYKVVFHFCQPK